MSSLLPLIYMKQQKKDTSHMIAVQPSGFVVNEWLEGRLALRDSNPEKYMRETSYALRVTVDRYSELKTKAEK
jgi:hypothetical protein